MAAAKKITEVNDSATAPVAQRPMDPITTASVRDSTADKPQGRVIAMINPVNIRPIAKSRGHCPDRERIEMELFTAAADTFPWLNGAPFICFTTFLATFTSSRTGDFKQSSAPSSSARMPSRHQPNRRAQHDRQDSCNVLPWCLLSLIQSMTRTGPFRLAREKTNRISRILDATCAYTSYAITSGTGRTHRG